MASSLVFLASLSLFFTFISFPLPYSTSISYCNGPCITLNDCDNQLICINGTCNDDPEVGTHTCGGTGGGRGSSPSPSPSGGGEGSTSYCHGPCKTLNDCDGQLICINGKCNDDPDVGTHTCGSGDRGGGGSPPTSPPSPAKEEESDHENRRRLLLISLLPLGLISIFIALGGCYLKGKLLKTTGTISTSALDNDAPHLQVFSFSNIQAATNNFSSENKLGEGGFGPVFKGKLKGGQEMAVKRLSKTSTQGHHEFSNEVTLTAKLQHVNLVRVLGFCTEKEEKMLIYEYMPNKSLDFYLFDPSRRYFLDWSKRVHIIEGVTQGLLYLQEYSNFTIIHRDLKASNILLDHEMNAKISDFGMAKLFGKDELEANTSRIVGTYGYVPPEYVRNGIYSMKYDVYSFGVFLLQIISGRRNSSFYGPNESLHLLEYAYESWKEGKGMEFIDPSLNDSSSSCKLLRCLQIALLCVQENPEDRPTMLEVYSMLKTDTEAIAIPGKTAFSGKRDENVENVPSEQGSCSVNTVSTSELLPR